MLDANIEACRAIRNVGHAILSREDAELEEDAHRKTCLRFFKLMCATASEKSARLSMR